MLSCVSLRAFTQQAAITTVELLCLHSAPSQPGDHILSSVCVLGRFRASWKQDQTVSSTVASSHSPSLQRQLCYRSNQNFTRFKSVFYVFMRVHITCVPWHACGGPRTAFMGEFSASTSLKQGSCCDFSAPHVPD